MESLKYTVIKNKTQYKEYCKVLEELIDNGAKGKAAGDEVDLLTLLIEKWDDEHNSFMEVDPIKLLHSFMADHKLKAKDLVKLLNVSKGYVSDILNYKKGLSKEIIRDLAAHFKVSQEAFNRPYKLKSPINARLKNASVMNTRKSLVMAH
jgi:HTH-type transcriptional regulator / antitoxin HigA